MWVLAVAFLIPALSGDAAVPAGTNEPEKDPE